MKFVSERLLSQLQQNFERVRSREPHRGHRTRHLTGGRMNRTLPLAKRGRGGALTGSHRRVITTGGNPRQDNPYAGLPTNPDNIGVAVGEYTTDYRFNLGAFNNVSVQRDFFAAVINNNMDILASSSPNNPSYAPGGNSQKPTLYDFIIDPAVVRGPAPAASPNPITYVGLLALRNFNPALPVKIIGQVEDEDVFGGGKGLRQPLPPAPPFPATIILELDIMPNGWNGVTYDTGFYYLVWQHDYVAGAAADVTLTTPVHFYVLGYEG